MERWADRRIGSQRASESAKDECKVDAQQQHKAQPLAGSKDLLSVQVGDARGQVWGL